jgi:hypothetical protein
LLALHLDRSESGDRSRTEEVMESRAIEGVASQSDVVRVAFSAGWQAAWTADSLVKETRV